MWSRAALREFYVTACTLDVQAFKPGNVSERSAGHGMQASDFIASAHASAAAMTEPGIKLGERIHRAIVATHDAVATNTNLGIVLLCAPVLQAVLDTEPVDLRAAVRQVLRETTQTDADNAFRAIRLASPAGLGKRERADVRDPAELSLRDSMALAADSDLIAAQYANGFEVIFETAVPHLEQAWQRWHGTPCAVTDLYLFLLSRFDDSHVGRKHGVAVARELRALASDRYQTFLRADSEAVALDGLDGVDADLKSRAINPGTSADFCVASLLLHRLLRQPAYSTGKSRSHLRTLRPTGAKEVPHLQSSQ